MSASTHSPVLKHHFEDLGQQHACERLGIWMFLTTEILFFGGLFAAYTVYRMWYPAEFVFASSHLNRTFATINTAFLITSSLTITLAIRSAKLGERGALIRNLLITAALATAFMVVKGFEYAEDFHEHLVPGPTFSKEVGDQAVSKNLDPGKVQLFLCFYYIMTGIHGIHIIVGIGCILWVTWEAWRGTVPPENYSTVEVVSLYWHLVDAIWLFLMPLLYLAGAGYGAHH
ncbi:MAG TPA: cytochrome c oxidase subunit 3 [Gemmata sp.]